MKNKLDPRTKLFVFLVTCVVVMNTPNSLFTIIQTTFIMFLGLYLGEFKAIKNKYITLVVSLIIEQILILVPESASTIFLLIVIVLIKIYIPILMAFHIVYKTTTISEFMAGFAKIKLPPAFIIPFAVMFRFIPTVEDEWDGIRHAMGFRGIGIRFKTAFFHPMQTCEYIIVPLLFSCVNVMDELVSASLARGLDISKPRTCVAKVKLVALDYFIMIITILLLIYAIML